MTFRFKIPNTDSTDPQAQLPFKALLLFWAEGAGIHIYIYTHVIHFCLLLQAMYRYTDMWIYGAMLLGPPPPHGHGLPAPPCSCCGGAGGGGGGAGGGDTVVGT